jgi:hypothetical protein
MRKIRPLGWIIIIFNIWYLFQMSKSIVELSAQPDGDLAVGLYAIFSILIWALINVVLYVIYRVTNRRQRRCPACDSTVKAGVTVCGKCDFDFMKRANGDS